MKRTLFLLLSVLISTAASAQMVGAISTERTISGPQITNRTKSVTYQDTSVVTSVYDSVNQISHFYWTQLSTTSVLTAKIPGIQIKDFCIFKDTVYFCGKNTLNYAVVGWININDLFTGSANIHAYHFVYAYSAYKISAYSYSDGYHLAVLAVSPHQTPYTYYLIDFNTSSSVTTYDYIVSTSEYFTDLTQTDNYIAVSGDLLNRTDFSILKYKKGNIQNNDETVYQFASGFSPFSQTAVGSWDSTSYIMTNEANTDNIFLAATLQDNASDYGYRTYIHHIDVNTFNPIYTQILDNGGKPFLKDIKYNSSDSRIYLLAGCSSGQNSSLTYNSQDVIYEFLKDTVGASMDIIPHVSHAVHDNLNSLTFYADSSYYLVSGNNNAGLPYLFDRNLSVLSSHACYIYGKSAIFQDNVIVLNNNTYQPTNYPKQPIQITYGNTVTNFSIPCQN